MSEAYLDVVERFIRLQEIMKEDDKRFRKDPRKTARIASLLAMASLYSKFELEKQYKVYKAMIQTISEKMEEYKTLGESIYDIAATLILASEQNKYLRK
ncbi:MAG: hypothetical protein ACTSW1_12595 [Candidatus Hodarchaeales archaeon]